MDQFASKVVEKCLKIGGSEFLERYLDRVCEGRADRPRIPLIDSEPNLQNRRAIAYFQYQLRATNTAITSSSIFLLMPTQIIVTLWLHISGKGAPNLIVVRFEH